MLNPLSIWRAGVKALRERDVYGATVRPMDVSMEGRYVKHEFAQLLARYLKFTKVAVSRNAVGVASTPLRVLIRKRGGVKSAWTTRRMGDKEFARIQRSADPKARKFLDYGDDVEVIEDPLHPLVRLLDKPNPWQSGFELIESLQTCVGMVGNGYWAKTMEQGLWQLWGLGPQYVEVLPDKTKFVSGYRYGRGTEVERVFSAEDVVHFKQFNPNDPYYGVGDLASHIEDADLSLKFTKAANALLDNGAQPGLIAVAKGATTAQAATIEEALNRKHAGAWRWFKSIVLRGEYEFETLELSKGAVEFLKAPSDAVRETIAACHDMPVELLTIKPGGLSASSDAMRQWQALGLLPRCQRIASRINAGVVPMFDGEQAGDLFVAFDNPVTEDEDAKTTREVAKRAARITTLNESRSAFGLPEIEGGDDMEPSQEQLAIDRREADDKRAAAGDDAGVAEPEKGLAPRLIGRILHDWGTDHPALRAGNGHPNGHAKARPEVRATALWAKGIAGSAEGSVPAKRIDELERAVKRAYDAIKAEVAASIAVGNTENPMLGVDVRGIFDREVGGLLADDFGKGWEVGRIQADYDSPFDVSNERAMRFLEEYRLRLADSVHQTLEADIRAKVREGLEAGGSVTDIAEKVKETIGEQAGYKAEQIARTETARAYTAGQQGSWSDVEVVKGVEWLLSANPCPVCEAMSAKGVVTKGAPFWPVGDTVVGSDGKVYVNDYAPVYGPPAHPGCRCAVAPVIEVPA